MALMSATTTCAYCTLPLGRRPYRLSGALQGAEAAPLLFCCQGCAWVFQIFGGRGEGSEAVLAAARLLAALAAGMVVMIGGWARYLDALLGDGRAASPWPAQPPGGLEAFYARVYEPLAAGAVFALLGWPILRNAAAGLRRGSVGLDALVALGVLAAYLGSLLATVRGSGATYYDTATMVLLLITFGRYVESTARARASRGLRRLLAAPAEAEILRDGVPLALPADAVRLDDVVLVRPGSVFPVDGLVLEGTGGVDEAALTGESQPVLKEPGAAVIAGAVSHDGAFWVQPTRVGADTFLRRLDALVEQARLNRAPVERLADRLAAALTATALVVGAGTFAYWGLYRGDPAAGLLYSLAVLLIACPCALGIATPLALRAGLAEAARRGILIREAAALETLGRVRWLFVDKTGTLTSGQPRLRDVTLLPGASLTADEALALAGALAQRSEHPASRALAAAAPPPTVAVEDFRAWPGLGVSGLAGRSGDLVALGSLRLLAQLGFTLPCDAMVARPGESVVYLGCAGRAAAAFGLVDAVRPSTPGAVRAVERLGIHLAVLTGDSATAAARLRDELGLSDIRAGLPPGGKAELVAAVPRCGGAVAMLGDGVNDGPALAAADVGIAMGNGTDLARTTAPVVLAGDDLGQVAWLLGLARRVRATVRTNLFWAALYNVLGIGLAAAGLLQPALAAAAMVVSSLLVVGNSLRLSRREGS